MTPPTLIERLRAYRPTNEWGDGVHHVICDEAADRIERLEAALQKIERWFGEFTDTGREWNDGSPMSYAACFGSNGERDFMRDIARQALAKERDDG